jgi:hypothetical protein
MIDLGDNKQVIVTSDERKPDTVYFKLWAFGGGLGVELTKKQAIQLRALLLRAILECEN